MASEGQSERIGWWCGLAGLLLIAVGFFMVDGDAETAASPDGPIGALVDSIANRPGRIAAGSVVGMIGALFLVGFGSALRIRLARHRENGALIGLAAFGFSCIAAVGAFIHGSFRLALTSVSDRDVLAETLRPLAMIESVGMGVLGWGVIGLTLVMSIAGFTVGLLPKAMGVVGIGLSIAAIGFATTTLGAFGVLLLVWLIVAAAILLSRTAERPRTEVQSL